MGRPDAAGEIKRYLETGKHDMLFPGWSGENTIDRLNRGHAAMLNALVDEVKRRAGTPDLPAAVQGLDSAELGRRKAEPMVRGLFPRAEQDIVLSLVERSVVFVTPANIKSVLLACDDLSYAWDIANLYLISVGAKPLSQNAPRLVGFSEELICYVSTAYFEDEDPFADFVVHELAHTFHNCRRCTVGLHETRRKKSLLEIDFRKRETFAYACEAYSRILERAGTPAERRALARESDGFNVSDDRVDQAQVASLVRAACERRNGWKVILAHCAPPRRKPGVIEEP